MRLPHPSLSLSTSIACPSWTREQLSDLPAPFTNSTLSTKSEAMSCLCLLDSNKINIFDDRFVWFNRSWSTSLYTTPRRSWICGLSTTDPYFSGSDRLCGAPKPAKCLFHKLMSVPGCLFHFFNRSFWVFNYNTCSRSLWLNGVDQEAKQTGPGMLFRLCLPQVKYKFIESRRRSLSTHGLVWK